MEINGTKRDLENMTTTKETIAELDALRAKHGADSQIGHICSNLIVQVTNLHKETDATARNHLHTGIARQQEHLARLLRDPQ